MKRATIYPLIVILFFGTMTQGDEGRIEISQADVTGSPFTYVITNAGSYILTENITFSMTGYDGISVEADNVTIDLNGFMLRGPGNNSGSGIQQDSLHTKLAVKNGCIEGWQGLSESGIQANGKYNQFENLMLYGNTTGMDAGEAASISYCTAVSNIGDGFLAGAGSSIVACTARQNGDGGIDAFRGCSVTACAAYENGEHGISLAHGCAVTHCATYGNTWDGIASYSASVITESTAFTNVDEGIQVSSACEIRNCATRLNNGTSGGIYAYSAGHAILGCAVSGNSSDGIYGGAGSTIRHCTISDHPSEGIYAGDDNASILENVAFQNGVGIRVYRTNSVQRNLAAYNETGFMATGSGNFIFKNSATANTTTNYQIATSNAVGPQVSSGATAYECANFDF